MSKGAFGYTDSKSDHCELRIEQPSAPPPYLSRSLNATFAALTKRAGRYIMMGMKTMIVTGFMPFGGEEINPAWEAAAALAEEIGGVRIVKVHLPVSYERSWSILKEAIDREKPGAVLMLGQAGGRTQVMAERVGRNKMDCASPDCDGVTEKGTRIEADGPEEILSPLAERLSPPLGLSEDAGGYVCNCLCYKALRGFDGPCAFIHVPYCEDNLGAKAGKPYMPQAEINRLVRLAAEKTAEEI